MKLGIAFAGGGVRGASHLGVVKALHEADIKPEIFAGTSAGSIVASLLANDIDPEKALEHLKAICSNIVDVDYFGIISDALHLQLINGFAKGKSLQKDLDSVLNGMKITQVTKPLAIVSTDINSGTQMVITNQPAINRSLICDDNVQIIVDGSRPLSFFVTASCSLPVIYQPKSYGSYDLVDGGLVNNLPSDAVKAMGADRIISVDLGLNDEVNQPNDIIHIITQTIAIFMQRAIDNDRQDFDIYLNPNIHDVHVLDTSRIDECFERGYNYAKTKISKIEDQLGGK